MFEVRNSEGAEDDIREQYLNPAPTAYFLEPESILIKMESTLMC